MPLHPSRRTAVVEWAQRTDGYVLDDDYDGEFRYDRQPIGALQALSPDRMVYLGSTSKSLSQTLRLGWMVVPDGPDGRGARGRRGQQFYVDAVSQLTMAEFIVSGQYDRHIRRMRTTLPASPRRAGGRLDGFQRGHQRVVRGREPAADPARRRRADVLRRAGEAGIALNGLSMMRHPLAGPEIAGSRRDHRRVRRAGRACVRRGGGRFMRCADGQRAVVASGHVPKRRHMSLYERASRSSRGRRPGTGISSGSRHGRSAAAAAHRRAGQQRVPGAGHAADDHRRQDRWLARIPLLYVVDGDASCSSRRTTGGKATRRGTGI